VEETPIGASGLESSPGSRMSASTAGQSMGLSRARFSLDISDIKKLDDAFKKVETRLKKIDDYLKNIARNGPAAAQSLQDVVDSLPGGGGGGSIGLSRGGKSNNYATALEDNLLARHQTRAALSGKADDDPSPTKQQLVGATLANQLRQIAAGQAGSLASVRQNLSGSLDAQGLKGTAVSMGIGAAEAAVGKVSGFIAQGVQKLDERIARGYEYSLAADKMQVMYQQIHGMGQEQANEVFRRPLTNYRLGGDQQVNTLLGMQAATGINALNQAGSIEALRTVTGYGASASDIAGMVTHMASPEVVNRMYFTTGMAMYGPGGEENQSINVVQNLVRAAGLTDERVLKTAIRQGSMSRARLSFMGVEGNMQDLVIQYAQQNQAFKEAGGQGFYDPSVKEHRERMKIEGNFATAKEETERVKVAREEQFYTRQNDNFETLEIRTKDLIRAFAALEDQLSGIIGAQIETTPYRSAIGGGLSSVGNALFGAAGVAAMFGPAGWKLAGVLALAGGAAKLGGGLMGRGDGPESSSGGTASPTSQQASGSQGINNNLSVPTYGKNTTLGQLRTRSDVSNLHPSFRDRVLRMITASGGRVGIGEGSRSYQSQVDLFLSRYVETNNEAEATRRWNGKMWKKTHGADVAAPGKSMHGIGLAADLVGDLNWVQANAERFGLKTFANVNQEPWHVQPAELPNGYHDYMKAGAPWGSMGYGNVDPNQIDDQTTSNSPFDVGGGEHGGGSSGYSGSNLRSYAGMSISEMIEAGRMSNLATLASSGSVVGGGTVSAPSHIPQGGTPYSSSASGALSGDEIVALMESHGFSGTDLIKAVGISYRESSWRPTAYNPNRKTKDKSYGLFQINMIDSLGPSRRQWFGIGSNEQLFDPDTNVRATQMMRSGQASRGKNPWYDWGPYKGESETYAVDMAKAAATVHAAKKTVNQPRGDYGGVSSPSKSVTTVVQGGTNITVAPVIHIHSSGSIQADLPILARDVGSLLRKEVELVAMRSS
jgi:hypothetical protein